ncbi:GNAT family N-acetyltransferase [Nocardioides sp. GXQ0305]|uniref:GNAT family N-acetyltransferase n=1 Tax=Nocardioides sp. GXQ0305 TaxID=3423912 RepID=UPI003D7C9C36
MSESDVQVALATDHERFVATDALVWFEEPDELPVAEQMVGVPPEQRFAADRPGSAPDTFPGIYGVRPMQLSVPAGTRGRLVPMAGLTWVGVHPDHRRRGVLTAMMRHHVEQTHREGLALSGLHASEPVIYGRYGYGLASQSATLSVSRGTTFTAPGLDDEAGAMETRLGSESGRDLVQRVLATELRVAEALPGSVVGAEGFYTAVLRETPQQLRDKEPRRTLFAVRDGVDVGLAAFRRTHKWEQHRPNGTLEVIVLIGEPAARLALLRRLVDFDLMGTVKLPDAALDDPVWQWLGPRAAGEVVPVDNLWLRVVDLEAALPLRSYDGECDVVVDLVDPLAPWQAGRWRIVVKGGEGRAERTDAAADASLPVAALGAAYLGGTNLIAMHRAGLLPEVRAGAVAELWRAFRTDLPPTAAIGF